MAARVSLIPGDGIGPEVTQATLRLLEAAGADIEWEEVEAKPIVGMRTEDARVDPLVTSLQRNRVGLKGPITTPVGMGGTTSTEQFISAVIAALE